MEPKDDLQRSSDSTQDDPPRTTDNRDHVKKRPDGEEYKVQCRLDRDSQSYDDADFDITEYHVRHFPLPDEEHKAAMKGRTVLIYTDRTGQRREMEDRFEFQHGKYTNHYNVADKLGPSLDVHIDYVRADGLEWTNINEHFNL